MNKMLQNKDKRCLFMGLPSSGKSTFIGALWHVLVSKEIDSLYTIHTEPENRTYLNALRDAWIEFRSPGRTSGTALSNIVTVKILEKESKNSFALVFPDASGEFYESQFAYRKLSSEYVEMVKSMNGILIFVNPDFLVSSNLITDASEILYDKFFEDKAGLLGLRKEAPPQSDNMAGNGVTPDVEEKPPYIEWKEKYSQSQVVLIDLLQMIMLSVERPCRIALIVSAWDTIKELPRPYSETNPVQWFSQKLPLLKQFLTSNSNIFTYSVFGVSAQGGEYNNKEENQIYQISIPAQRIKIQVEDNVEHDITIPIKWVLNG